MLDKTIEPTATHVSIPGDTLPASDFFVDDELEPAVADADGAVDVGDVPPLPP